MKISSFYFFIKTFCTLVIEQVQEIYKYVNSIAKKSSKFCTQIQGRPLTLLFNEYFFSFGLIKFPEFALFPFKSCRK